MDKRFVEVVKSGVFGLAVADACGVPVEFSYREDLDKSPVTEMFGYGTYNQPPGTWSDDTSMTLCLMDTLCEKYELINTMEAFCKWYKDGEYTPFGICFDIGMTVEAALRKFINGTEISKCGAIEEDSNGNGSLMRILPLAFYIRLQGVHTPFERKSHIELVHSVSALTHAHMRSMIACGIYTSVAMALIDNPSKESIKKGLYAAKQYYLNEKELKHYWRIFKNNFGDLPRKEIKSSGYVVDTLEAALWCLYTTENYEDCVLKAVNLGSDTDTVAAVAGGLAGLLYGLDYIPSKWIDCLIQKDIIIKCCENFLIRNELKDEK